MNQSSSFVSMALLFHDERLPIAQLGPDWCELKEPALKSLCGGGLLTLSVDGHASVEHVNFTMEQGQKRVRLEKGTP
jgi:hypothetical protein